MTEKSEEVTENTQAPFKKGEEIEQKTKNEEENTLPSKNEGTPEESPPEPKARGRPKGVRDTKPRVKRVPILPPEQEVPKAKPKKVQVREEPEEQESEERVVPQVDAQPPTPEPVKMKSPRTQRRERMQAFSAQRHAELKARQNRFDSLIDNFMGY
jgi:hypothetical protein